MLGQGTRFETSGGGSLVWNLPQERTWNSESEKGMAKRTKLGPYRLSLYRIMCLHLPFVLGFFPLFPIRDGQQ